MAVPPSGTDKRCEPFPPGLLHDYVQRSGMVRETPTFGMAVPANEARRVLVKEQCYSLDSAALREHTQLANKFLIS